MQIDLIQEARRQAEICNACRYCEGYCSVFPALHRERVFADGDITQLANLCHNCRGCYYACQYTAPHEFDLNLPKALAEVRQDSWKAYAWPAGLAKLFDRSGVAIAVGLVLGFALLFLLAQALRPESGKGFYAYMSHSLMVAVFTPAFLLPLAAIALSLRSYWQSVGGGRLTLGDVWSATRSAGRMKNLEGGHGDGCNFEDEDRFSQARRHFHQATLYGFLMCFASTSSGTVLHYGFGLEAPYGLFSLPKLFGVPGGVLLCLGTAGLAWLKTRADPNLGAPAAWGGEMAFVLLLFFVSLSGLLLYAATGTVAAGLLLPLHLGAVLTFFLLTPYSKMAHGFFRMTAMAREAMLAREARKQ
ncbi:tricarballylate utilization 4Fe-4S protein TcuB [Rhodophyticola porphyridii]|uniref:Tricarballylate utilization 4Fe-4S protein TcuB n=1 Tax=Rhodophyticola porphyridii TaxID=1852017 RepID=A0A3L9Y0R4_9RHOB|nr:tricarballylate utilization 4Fe-4S protein TcuB [Rhodophyticola porphyridii]RMA40667.1 tricarballylate utilization 4Fe-4S protein TcuB [Rhodophyticola porphyridii]